MVPDGEAAPCPQCAYSTTVFIATMGSVCALLLLLSIFRIIRSYCILSSRFPFLSRRTGSQHANRSANSLTRLETGGLASAVIITLPAVRFKKKAEGDEDDENQNSECPICLGMFKEGEWLRLLPNCAHAFHVSCVDIWLHSSSNCPICRADVLKDGRNFQPSDPVRNSLEIVAREEPRQEIARSQHVVEMWVLSYDMMQD